MCLALRHSADGGYVAVYFFIPNLSETAKYALSASYVKESCPRCPCPPRAEKRKERISQGSALKTSRLAPAKISTYGLTCLVLKLFDFELVYIPTCTILLYHVTCITSFLSN